ncbi:DgyrCDS362 [Dimorphilus gyrociliatus]|uniref:COMM domain-containing protein 3 n=1 Tax=Dimorphilus gyrociliatus TaxID=2664684 RepID=A0A7I8V5K5_9ANNE|nr:DgyrCDS362 [Dimorphilus gyrociliatus]
MAQLSEKAAIGLAKVSALKDIAVKSITHTAFQQILDCSRILSYSEYSEFQDIERSDLEQCFLGLTSFILEVCKNDLSEDLIRCYLIEDYKWTDDRTVSFLNKLKNYKQKIRARLSCITWQHPHIIDSSWKLNINAQSQSLNAPQAECIVKLQLEDCSEKDNFSFRCDTNSLQDMVLKLKECSRSVTNYGSE